MATRNAVKIERKLSLAALVLRSAGIAVGLAFASRALACVAIAVSVSARGRLR